ncbi:hypothetical protein ACNOYE_31405 [Nannocystaceae bacterium ST9]
MARALGSSIFACGLVLGCAEPSDPGTDEVGSESESSESAGETDSGDSSSDSGEETGVADCTTVGPWNSGYVIPSVPQAPGDPEAGRWALLNEDYVTCGVPWDLFGLAKNALGSMGEGETLPWREGKNAEVPTAGRSAPRPTAASTSRPTACSATAAASTAS